MRERISRLLRSRVMYMILALALALLYWMVLAISDETPIEKVLYDVPVQLDYNASMYQSFNLDIIGTEPVTVDVTVSGPPSVVNDLTADDVLVYPNVNSVTTAGTRTLRLIYSSVNSTANFTITHLSQETVTLRFDTIVTQSFPVRIDPDAIQVAEGYLLGPLSAAPGEITVTGPAQEVSTIASVQATLPLIAQSGPLAASQQTQGTLQLLDAQGQPVDRTLLTLASETVDVSVTVLRHMEMALQLQFLNVPPGFSTDTLGARMDHETISVAVPTDVAADATLAVYMDMDTFDYLGENTVPIGLPENYTRLDNIDTVTVTFDTADYATRLVTVSDIRVVNVPAGKTVTVDTERIYNVELAGPAQAIARLDQLEEAELLEGAVVAQVDASRLRTNSGQQTMEVQILLPTFNNVFALGSYTVVVGVG